jgi:hypothetical protein
MFLQRYIPMGCISQTIAEDFRRFSIGRFAEKDWHGPTDLGKQGLFT